MQQLTGTDVDNPLAAVVAMYNLEDSGELDLQSLDSNHVVIRQNDHFIEPGYHVWQYLYLFKACPLTKSDLNSLHFVINSLQYL